jgi:hypothetical protein
MRWYAQPATRARIPGHRVPEFFDALVILTNGEPWMPAATWSDHNDFNYLTSYAESCQKVA